MYTKQFGKRSVLDLISRVRGCIIDLHNYWFQMWLEDMLQLG